MDQALTLTAFDERAFTFHKTQKVFSIPAIIT